MYYKEQHLLIQQNCQLYCFNSNIKSYVLVQQLMVKLFVGMDVNIFNCFVRTLLIIIKAL